jgi:hypothetical protein
MPECKQAATCPMRNNPGTIPSHCFWVCGIRPKPEPAIVAMYRAPDTKQFISEYDPFEDGRD